MISIFNKKFFIILLFFGILLYLLLFGNVVPQYTIKNNYISEGANALLTSLGIFQRLSHFEKHDNDTEEVIVDRLQGLKKCPCRVRKIKNEVNSLKDVNLADPFEEDPSVNLIRRKHPNLGSILLSGDPRCEMIPSISKIHWDGIWQKTQQISSKGDLYHFYSASCDLDEEGLCSVIRVVGVSPQGEKTPLYCHAWTDIKKSPVVSTEVETFRVISKSKVRLETVLLSCRMETPVKVVAVSLGVKHCYDLTNFIQINEGEREVSDKLSKAHKRTDPNVAKPSAEHQNVPSPYDVGVCGPALFYYHYDISKQLVEWFEILKAMKVSKVFLYATDVHPNVSKVLWYYEKQGFLGLTQFSYPSPYVNEPALRRMWTTNQRSEIFTLENTYFTDCILRNRYQFRYLMHIDPDELPMLQKYSSISEFVKSLSTRWKNKPINFHLHWLNLNLNLPPTPALANVSTDFFFLRHNQYTKKCESRIVCGNVKPIFDTRQSLAVHSHRANKCKKGNCNIRRIQDSVGRVAHFRRTCDKDCTSEYLDSTNYYVKFVDAVVPAVQSVWNTLQI